MFSENQKISLRQTYRLFVFDLLGVGTLLLPTQLARFCGNDGIFCILFGGILGFGYLFLLGAALKKMRMDFLEYTKKHMQGWIRKVLLLYLVLYSLLFAGFCSNVFANLIQYSLIPEESYALILLLILLVSAYAVSGGMESRARVYEILFLFVLLPLVIMLVAAAKDVEPSFWLPLFTFQIGDFWRGSYMVFAAISIIFYILFFPSCVKEKEQKKLVGCVGIALSITIVILGALYLILVGTFGSAALSNMRFPAVTLMSTVQIKGNFLKRTDALMLGVWFFTLFALLNLHVYYASKMAQELVNHKEMNRKNISVKTMNSGQTYRNKTNRKESNGNKAKENATERNEIERNAIESNVIERNVIERNVTEEMKEGNREITDFDNKETIAKRSNKEATRRYIIVIVALVFVIAMIFEYGDGMMSRYLKILQWIGIPLLVMIPVVILFTGCTSTELEDRCFPMLAAVDYEKESEKVVFAYMFPRAGIKSEEGQNAAQIDVAPVEGQNFTEAREEFEREVSKKPDPNHLKVILMGENLVENHGQYERMLEELQQDESFPRNTYVCITSDVKALLEQDEQRSMDIGGYLEELIENHERKGNQKLPTIGNLMDEKDNRRRTLEIPYIEVENHTIVWRTEYVMNEGIPVGVKKSE